LSELTATERRVLALLTEYKTNREIAAVLFVSVRTIENHRANICSKLNLHGTHALMKFALKHKSELS
jgi:DNA-binding CsgD family transcriptional regulator